jgi:hypothetical protein
MARDTYKLQVELNQKQLEALNELQDAGGLRTKKELLDNALTLLKWAVRQKREGNLIVSMNAATGGIRELQLPYLETARENFLKEASHPARPPREVADVAETAAAGQASRAD